MKQITTIIVILCLAFITQAQNCISPRAEWNNACSILMFTPGDELFNGLIHPGAALFEEYFDADAAADEHRNYIQKLEANGIKIFNVKSVLEEIGIDTLRNMATEVLKYDISGLAAKDTAEFGQNYRLKILNQMSRKDLVRILLLQPTCLLYTSPSPRDTR